MSLITQELQDAVRKVFRRFAKHGCAMPWGEEIDDATEFLLDACAVLADAGITVEDVGHAYGALMALECIRYHRWPSNHEILEAINSRRPGASDTAVKAEATTIFGKIVEEVAGGRHRLLDVRVRDTFGLAAAEALAAIGGPERVNSAGEDYRGALWSTFQTAYCAAVAGGRERADPLRALPAPKPLLALPPAAPEGLKRISGSLTDVLGLKEGRT